MNIEHWHDYFRNLFADVWSKIIRYWILIILPRSYVGENYFRFVNNSEWFHKIAHLLQGIRFSIATIGFLYNLLPAAWQHILILKHPDISY